MALDGKWNIEINSPMGVQKGVVELTTNGDALSGSQTAMGSTLTFDGGKAEGDRGTWSSNVTSPMPMKLSSSRRRMRSSRSSGALKLGSRPRAGARGAPQGRRTLA